MSQRCDINKLHQISNRVNKPYLMFRLGAIRSCLVIGAFCLTSSEI